MAAILDFEKRDLQTMKDDQLVRLTVYFHKNFVEICKHVHFCNLHCTEKQKTVFPFFLKFICTPLPPKN